MYGPKPPAARRLAQPQQPLMDGGLVARMKSADAGPAAFGSRGLSQLRDMIPKMQAMGYQQAPATPATDPRAAKLQAMIPQMEAMGFKQNPQYLAGGGMIRGPGTGTSDSIPDEMEPGTYIMPADSTKQLGLDDKKVPVRVSNGEYELPPEQVQAVGAAVLDAIKGVTHTPKSLSARGLKSANGEEQAFSGGGQVRREEGGGLSKEAVMAAIAKQASQQQPAQQPAARRLSGLATDFLRNPGGILAQRERQAGGYADGGQVRARWQDNLDELQNPTPYQGQVGNLFLQPSGTAAQVAAIRPGVYRGDAGRGTVNPPAVAPQNTTQPESATDPASASMAGAGRGTVNPPIANPSAPAPTNAQAPGGTTGNVTRVGNTYSGTNVSGDITVNGQAPRGGFMVADGARGFNPGVPATAAPQGVTGPTVRHSGNDWAARNALRNAEVSASSIMNTRRWGGRGAENNPSALAYQAMLKNDLALQGAQPGVDVAAMRENAGIQREGMQQEGATTRTGMTEQGANARESGRNILARDEFNLRKEASGFQTRAAQQQEQLRNVLIDPKSTPEQRAVAQRNLAALSGKTAADRMQTVTLPDTTNEMGQVVRGGQALVRTLEDGTVQQVPIGAQGQAQLPPGMTRQVGTSNGRPVYEDAKGNRFGG